MSAQHSTAISRKATPGEVLADLDRIIAGAAPGELPALVGRLVELEERARLRLRTEPGTNGHARPERRNLSAEEAARRLGVSKPYLYKHADEFFFTSRMGNRVVFDAEGLEAWNRGQR